jgi:Histidine kinase-, DNA gyrase B-, and HSP90-like ATPase
MSMSEATIPEGLREQRELIERLEDEDFGWDLMIGDAFVRGMRDIGYKGTAFALAELVDNAIQASATHIDILFGFDGGKTKPKKIAVVDNGHGMDPKMVRASLIWGAGTRMSNSEGFGKYGYGLPSASVSQSLRVSVYSKPPGGDWHRCYLDIEEIKEGLWTKGNRIEVPEVEKLDPPDFVIDQLGKSNRWPLEHGTVVVWDELDQGRIDYRQRSALRARLLTQLGVIYRNYLNATPMMIDGVDVEPCDPLFLTEGFRYYDLDDDRAIELDPATVEVKDKETREVIGRMRVRFARMPATFFRKPDAKDTNKPNSKTDMNERLEIADANNGIIFLRAGRQIDVVRPPRNVLGGIANVDRFWAIEVDFDPSLDDLFWITTAKQQVTPDERIWDMLRDKAKVFEALGNMRTVYRKEAAKLSQEAESANEGRERASVEAVKEGKKFRTEKPPADTPKRREEADQNLEAETRRRADKAGVSPEAIKREVVAEREGIEFSVETEDMPGAPFYRCVQEGGTRVLYLNVAHRFYTELYGDPSSTPRLRAGLEVLLWTLGNAEVDADPESERRQFYERERGSVWSATLADSLGVLRRISVVDDIPETEVA